MNKLWKSWLKVEKFKSFIEQKGWSEPRLAQKLGIDYSYLFRVLREERNGGIKFILALLKLCEEEGIDPYEFINLDVIF